MKNWLVFSVGLGLTVTGILLYLFEPGPVQRISLVAYDALMQYVSRPAVDNRVVIVDIDEESLESHGQWPWPRYVLADLTERLLTGGADVVLFDVLFAEDDRTSPQRVIDGLNHHFGTHAALEGVPSEVADYDQIFADTLASGNTVLGCYIFGEKNGTPPPDPYYDARIFPRLQPGNSSFELHSALLKASDITFPIRALHEGAKSVAFINATVDFDNVVRANPLIWSAGKDRYYPSLALEAVRLATGAAQIVVEYDQNGVRRIRLNDLVIDTDAGGRAIINYRTFKDSAAHRSFDYFSAADVLTGVVRRDTFDGKIVFVGSSATGLMDIKATPLARNFAGVETHATLVDNILAGDVLRNPPEMRLATVALNLVIGLFLTWMTTRTRSWICGLCTILLVVGIIGLSITLLRDAHLIFVPATPLITAITIYIVLTTLRYGQEEVKRGRLRSIFGPMVSEEVMKYMEENPDSISLAGQDVEATVFFSDIAGFTPIAEVLSADEVTQLLNEYLSPMNQIILEARGYVDKYQGDSIMAEWGIPYPIADHATKACLAALAQDREIRRLAPELSAKYGHDVNIRMGINSGVVKAGYIGSEKRKQYTVIGDAVNQASRLEALNKVYGTRIIIGEETYSQAHGSVDTRLLDRVIVKGRTQPIKIYELIAEIGSLPPEKVRLAGAYETALQYHWERKWETALNHLAAALEIDPDDGPSAVLKTRIESYRQQELPAEWDGAFVQTAK
jgi:adenylate cyclase